MTDLHTHTNGAANGHAFSTINDNTTINYYNPQTEPFSLKEEIENLLAAKN